MRASTSPLRFLLTLLGACGAPAASGPSPPAVVDLAAPAVPVPESRASALAAETPVPEPERILSLEPPEPGSGVPEDFDVQGVGPVGGVVSGVPTTAPRPTDVTPPRLLRDPGCAFPPSATSDDARVLLEVFVDEKGVATRVGVIRDPGEGFAPAAVACLLGATYVPGRAPNGDPVAAKVVVNVKFSR